MKRIEIAPTHCNNNLKFCTFIKVTINRTVKSKNHNIFCYFIIKFHGIWSHFLLWKQFNECVCRFSSAFFQSKRSKVCWNCYAANGTQQCPSCNRYFHSGCLTRSELAAKRTWVCNVCNKLKSSEPTDK